MANDARRTAMFPGIDFTKAASTITTAARDQVVSALLIRFTKEKVPAPDDVIELQKLFEELRAASATTSGLMVSLCTASLGSAKSVIVL